MTVKSTQVYGPRYYTVYKNVDHRDTGEVVTGDLGDPGSRGSSKIENIYTLSQKDRTKFEFHPCTHGLVNNDLRHSLYTFYVGSYPLTRMTDDFHSLVCSLTATPGDTSNFNTYFRDLHPDLRDYTDDWCKSYFDWDALSAEAFDAMKPSLKTPLSLTQFLAEIRDLKRLFKMWDSRHKIIRNVSGAYLGYQFGWKQLKRDVENMIKLVVNFSERLDDFIIRSNSRQKRYFEKDLGSEDFSTVSATHDTGYGYVEHDAKLTSCKYRAVMVYDYDIPNLALDEMKRRALLDSLGLDLKPSTIWNLIPFSFIVDWFLNVNLFLASRERDWLEPALTIHDFCHSIKINFEGEVRCSYRGGNLQWAKRYRGKGYRRWPGIPDIGTTLSSTGFSTGRLAIAASLVGVRTR